MSARSVLGFALCAVAVCLPAMAHATEDAPPEWLSVHGQFTGLLQYHPSFHSPFEGPNSLRGKQEVKETTDVTVYAGVRLWDGFAFYINPEIDQGFGLSNTLGLAGFSSGEAYKVGKSKPYFRLQRAFFRGTLDLGGETMTIADAANQVAGTRRNDSIVITIGKFSAVDIFDTNTYAHDPRGDFFNWSIIDSGAYDYAADAWGYTTGAAIELNKGWWSLRTGVFNLSKVPNTTALETTFDQFELVAEWEARTEVFAQPNKVRILAFANRGRMARYSDAVARGAALGITADAAPVRKYQTRAGWALNVEQDLSAHLGAFMKLSANDGSKEAFEFTEINRSIAAGMSLNGTTWGRAHDAIGLAGVINDISGAAKQYFAAGGLGILIGDGQLPRKSTENIVETYYRAEIVNNVSATLDYQFIAHPAYNALRGPVHVLGARLHAEY